MQTIAGMSSFIHALSDNPENFVLSGASGGHLASGK